MNTYGGVDVQIHIFLTSALVGGESEGTIMTHVNKIKINSVALILKRTIPTERPRHVGEVSINFCE
jgi:hypothetical protein